MAATAEALRVAEDAINTQGFVTEKELPDLKDRDYTRELSAELTKAREKKQEKGYIYAEPFDFAGGEIENIVWNMDQIKTRADAKQTLATDMGLKMPETTLSEVDKTEF
ncbi:hypothetical protein [Lacticaseibacillus daqingensis]|uniref:hypothetical protein n=1 Tax=Lacticaseibacillus daqingensis TaxID=2486014 RepID=UPI000F7A8031|nr:hypothetical protein [Lacticaseibacillus daqingensis]